MPSILWEPLGGEPSFGGGPFFRPVSSLSFGLDRLLWGLEPFGYNLTNLLIHAACVAATSACAMEIGRSRLGAIVAGLFFPLISLIQGLS